MFKSRLALVVAIFVTNAQAQVHVTNGEELIKQAGLSNYPVNLERLKDVTIAVLDTGFEGYEGGKDLLPESTESKFDIAPIKNMLPTRHGLEMAQTIWALSGNRKEGPKFILFNVNGYPNMKAAVEYIRDSKVTFDIVLMAQTWDVGGNGDGKGFLNALINQVTLNPDVSKRPLWINSTGNFGKSVYNGKVLPLAGDTGFVQTQGLDGNALSFKVQYDETPITFSLTWNDVTDDSAYATKKDLDFTVREMVTGKIVAEGNKIQDGKPVVDEATHSRLPRELVNVKLSKGEYYVQIEEKSHNFTKDDRYRFYVNTQKVSAVDFVDHSRGQEIYPPADNPNLITVGDNNEYSSTGPIFDKKRSAKPDISLNKSSVEISNGDKSFGSSESAAIVAGAASVLLSEDASLTREELVNHFSSLRSSK